MPFISFLLYNNIFFNFFQYLNKLSLNQSIQFKLILDIFFKPLLIADGLIWTSDRLLIDICFAIKSYKSDIFLYV